MNTRHRRLNAWRRLALMPVLLLAVLILVLAVNFPHRGTAHALSGSTATATITITSPAKLIARTTLQVSGTVSCTIPAGATFVSAGGGVTVTQASGRVIVQASGGFFPATCDGTTQSFQVLVTSNAGSAPFHGGPATAFGNVGVNYIDAFGNFQEDFLNSNTQVISIAG